MYYVDTMNHLGLGGGANDFFCRDRSFHKLLVERMSFIDSIL